MSLGFFCLCDYWTHAMRSYKTNSQKKLHFPINCRHLFATYWQKAQKMTLQEFERLSERIRQKMLMLAGRFSNATSQSVEPEDIVQESLVALWRLSESGYPIRDAEALAVKIVKNTCVAHYRKRRIDAQPLGGTDYGGGMSASALTDDEDMAKIETQILGGLTSSQRMLLKMRNDDGLSLDEIAAVTGKPKASVKTTISVARKQMLEQLKRML